MTLIDQRPEPFEADMITEVGSILSNNSATAFSKLVDDRIFVETEFSFFFLNDFNREFDFRDDFSNIFDRLLSSTLEGFSVEISGGAEGVCLIVFPKDNINQIIDSVLPLIGKKGADVPPEAKDEIMMEFSNISMQAYITALSKLIGQPIKSSLPVHAGDMLGSLYHFRKNTAKDGGDTAVSLKTSISAKKKQINGKLIMFLTPRTYRSVVRKLLGA